MQTFQTSGLPDSAYHLINQRLEELARLQTEIQLAMQAGCSAGDQGKLCQQLTDQYSAMKRAYFADRP